MFNAIAAMNAAGRPIVAVDLPSGLHPDKGIPLDIAVNARLTVTLVAPKKGLLLRQARPYVGKLLVADIGIPLRNSL
jgi:NAD(P)H-hydrate epimerase